MKDRKFFNRKALFAAGLVLGLGTTVLAANDTISIGDGFAFLKRVGSTAEVNLGIGTDDPQAKVEVEGNVIGDDPTENDHLTTRRYVDARVSATTPSTGGSCYYTDSVLCDSGYHLANGIGLESLHICCPDAENNTGYNTDGILTNGYFVLTGTTWDGDLGGLAGANAKCLDELTDHPWKGKGDASALTSENVEAFLCSDTECQNLLPYTEYKFAVARNPAYGGAKFTSDMYGKGPGDQTNWGGATYTGGNYIYWTGRGGLNDSTWGDALTYGTCSSWTYNGLMYVWGTTGQSNAATTNRWYIPAQTCGSDRHLICMVHPTLNLGQGIIAP